MQDEFWMRRAIELAKRGEGRINPNPLVGCVIVKNEEVIGEGWHEQYGGPHAERNALSNCTEDPAGATLYVTLEPCCHWGKTPPCTDAILEKRISRVVIGCVDPNPQVDSRGITVLKERGVLVDTGVMDTECRAINEVFFQYITTRMPYVVMKYAMTLDGKIAAHTGDSKWVTGKEARQHVHLMRNRMSAIMVGVGTVLADDPLLTCRIEGGRNPVRIVCDSHLNIPAGCRLLRTARHTRTIVAAVERGERAEQIEQTGAEILICQSASGQVDIADLMKKLGEQGIDSVLIEGGAELHFSALTAGVVQKVQAYVAPKMIGGADAKTPVGGSGLPRMADAVPIYHTSVKQLGQDFLLEGVL